MTPVLTARQVHEFLDKEFPQLSMGGKIYEVINVAEGTATLRFSPNESHLRPGRTIMGPSLFALADVAAYIAIIAHIGPVVGAVTSNLSISFLRRPDPVPLDGIARVLKIGRKLAFIEVSIERSDTREIVAHASATYSIPSKKVEVL